jgi:hypothetical protein
MEKTYTKRLDLQAIILPCQVYMYLCYYEQWMITTPRTLHDNKIEEASVADFIGNKSME